MRLSNSKAKTWRRCPKRYEFRYVLDIQLKRRSRGQALGSWMHELLMWHYDGHDWRVRHKQLVDQFMLLFEEEREDLGDIPGDARRLMRSYERRYKEEDKAYTVVDSELDEIITLPNGLKFNFIIDLIVEDRAGDLWLWDHKNVKRFMPEDFMLLDAQLTRYFWCAERMGYTPLQGVMFNEILTKPPVVPKLTAKTKELERKSNMHTDYWTYLEAIRRHRLDPHDYLPMLRRLNAIGPSRFFRRTTLPRDTPATKTMMHELVMTAKEIHRATVLNEFPRTVDKDCTWDCDYLEPCMVQLQGGDIKPIVKRRYEKRKQREEV